MDWELELLFAGRVLLAALLGALIGLEREHDGCDAGIRTFAAVSVGACTFSLVSSHVPGSDPTRIAAQVVTGIGFIGAGVILQVKGRINGLTTAATVWACSAVGMACGFGMYLLATLTALLLLSTLLLHHLPGWDRFKSRLKRQHLARHPNETNPTSDKSP